MKIQSSQRTFWVWVATALLLVVLAFSYQQPSRPVAPAVPTVVTMHVDYKDIETKSGGGIETHRGNAIYTFRNVFTEPIKLVFPPIGYTFGAVAPISPQCTEVSRMPTFCHTAQVVELKPNVDLTFESMFMLSGPGGAPVEHFVFGPAKDPKMENVFVGTITTSATIHPAR